eukprot:gene10566-biopygen8854
MGPSTSRPSGRGYPVGMSRVQHQPGTASRSVAVLFSTRNTGTAPPSGRSRPHTALAARSLRFKSRFPRDPKIPGTSPSVTRRIRLAPFVLPARSRPTFPARRVAAMKLLAGNSNRTLATAIAEYLDVPLTRAQVRRFADNEVFVTIDENVRGEDVFVIQSTSYPANDNLMELLICIDALKRASGRRITAVLPYFVRNFAAGHELIAGKVPEFRARAFVNRGDLLQ